MPELPEVETVRRGLENGLVGQTIAHVDVRRPDLRFPFPVNLSSRLEGRRVIKVGRRAKYLQIRLDGAEVLVMHLGMSGRLSLMPGPDSGHPPPGKHDHLVIDLESGDKMVFNDPRRFGFVELIDESALSTHQWFAGLGPEPLGNDFNGAVLSATLRGKATPIKAALLDQRVVAGLGNIYVCEALHISGISPKRKAASVVGRRAERLVPAIRDVLLRAIESGGSTLRDYARLDGESGYFQHEFRVYGREGEPCQANGCDNVIKRIIQSGRSTFYCSTCQR